MNYQEAIAFIETYPNWERQVGPLDSRWMSLKTMQSLLSRLGNPHLGTKTIHVTGSKGKGSTASMIASILTASGVKTALFTSPSLYSCTEQIALDGKAVSRDEFARGVEAVRRAVMDEHTEQHPVSVFGILAATFFYLAKTYYAQWQVVEVGLGGASDATNVFQEKEAAVITPVSLEHTAILGRTPAAIAEQKSGIITTGCTAILAPQRTCDVKEVVAARCKQLGVKVIDVDGLYKTRLIRHNDKAQSVLVTGPFGRHLVELGMLGEHQLSNAATAVATVETLQEQGELSARLDVAPGLANVRLPGRLEVICQRPTIVLDGAHNGESSAAVCAAVKKYFSFKRCVVVLGFNTDKDSKAICENLAQIAEVIVTTRSKNPRAKEPSAIMCEPALSRTTTIATDSVAYAVEIALTRIDQDDLLLVTGSLAVVAEAREFLTHNQLGVFGDACCLSGGVVDSHEEATNTVVSAAG
ncbi:MAG: hypothetical protein HY711_08205 [Candidatus Melainabacteria bacterium]|nr:hypothetical protein [Candidatus Melainabacteria bacterium]